jgi:hypothetical protein
MPKSAKQRRGEIIYALRGLKLITPIDLRGAMTAAGVECAATRKAYENDLEDLGYLTRVPGGWKLTPASKQDGIILIRIKPSQNQPDVIRGLDAALQQFKPLTTMEIEA